MAKKIRFPLEMENDVQVRTLEELQNHFSLEKVLVYISNGKMITWLEDRYLKEMAQKVKELDSEDGEYNKKICEIFDVEYVSIDLDVDDAVERNRRIKILKELDFAEYIDVVDQIAFEQEDIYDLLDEEVKVIYLCNERFEIPISQHGIKYVGIGRAIAGIPSKEKLNFEEREIVFENIVFDEKYLALLDEYEMKELKAKKAFGEYVKDTYTKPLMEKEDVEAAQNTYNVLSPILEELDISVEDNTKNILNYLLNTGIEEWGTDSLIDGGDTYKIRRELSASGLENWGLDYIESN